MLDARHAAWRVGPDAAHAYPWFIASVLMIQKYVKSRHSSPLPCLDANVRSQNASRWFTRTNPRLISRPGVLKTGSAVFKLLNETLLPLSSLGVAVYISTPAPQKGRPHPPPPDSLSQLSRGHIGIHNAMQLLSLLAFAITAVVAAPASADADHNGL